MTTPLIKQSMRRHPRCHRHLALIPQIGKRSKAMEGLSKSTKYHRGRPTRNFHAMLDVCFQSIHRVIGGFPAMIRMGDKVKEMTAIPVFTKGLLDIKEKDGWCGRYPSHHKKMATISHCCMTPVEHAGDLGRQCPLINSNEDRKLCLEAINTPRDDYSEMHKKLQARSLYRHLNATRLLPMGANKRGIAGALPPDIILHVLREGIMAMAITILLNCLPSLRKGELDQIANSLFFDCPGQSTRKHYRRVKGNKGISHVTTIAGHEWVGLTMVISIIANTTRGQHIFMQGRKNSEHLPYGLQECYRNAEHSLMEDDDISTDGVQLVCPNINCFVGPARHEHRRKVMEQNSKSKPKGKTKKGTGSKAVTTLQEESNREDDNGLVAEELPDCNYDESLPQIQSDSKSYSKKYSYTLKDLPHTKDLVRLLETLLVFDAWANKEEHWRRGDDDTKKIIDDRIRQMLAMLYAIIPRYDGNGWDTSKIHALLHATETIEVTGSLLHGDTSPMETLHKWFSKLPAKTAQKRQEHIYLPQVGRRIDDIAIIEKARRRAGLPSLLPIQSEREEIGHSITNDPLPEIESPIQISEKTPAFVAQADEKAQCVSFSWKRKGSGDIQLHPIIRQYIVGMFQTGAIEWVEGYTEAKTNDITFRAHPQYRSEKPWYDWCRHEYKQASQDPDGEDVVGIGLAKILCFLRYQYSKMGVISEGALVHYCHAHNALDPAHDMLLQTNWRTCYQNIGTKKTDEYWAPYLHVIPLSSIVSQAFVVEESPGLHETIPRYIRAIEILPASEWADVFIYDDFMTWARNLYDMRKKDKSMTWHYSGVRWTHDGNTQSFHDDVHGV